MRRSTGIVALAATTALVAAAPASAASCEGQRWLGAWAAPPSATGESLSDQTLRLNLTPLRSGRVARVRLSNRVGTRTACTPPRPATAAWPRPSTSPGSKGRRAE